jgi:hypothetical protein
LQFGKTFIGREEFLHQALELRVEIKENVAVLELVRLDKKL